MTALGADPALIAEIAGGFVALDPNSATGNFPAILTDAATLSALTAASDSLKNVGNNGNGNG